MDARHKFLGALNGPAPIEEESWPKDNPVDESDSAEIAALQVLTRRVAHDLNNLLMIVRGYTELLLNDVTDPKSITKLRRILNAADDAAELADHLLIVARRSPGRRTN